MSSGSVTMLISRLRLKVANLFRQSAPPITIDISKNDGLLQAVYDQIAFFFLHSFYAARIDAGNQEWHRGN